MTYMQHNTNSELKVISYIGVTRDRLVNRLPRLCLEPLYKKELKGNG